MSLFPNPPTGCQAWQAHIMGVTVSSQTLWELNPQCVPGSSSSFPLECMLGASDKHSGEYPRTSDKHSEIRVPIMYGEKVKVEEFKKCSELVVKPTSIYSMGAHYGTV